MASKWRQTMFYGMTLTDEQEVYVDSIENNLLTICNAISGSGKTTLAVAMAHILQKNLLYLFSPIEEDKMGYRPGRQHEKDYAYLGPLIDALVTIGENPAQAIKSEDDAVAKSQTNAWVEAESHVFLRGTNIGEDGNLLVIIDEAQNWTKSELKKTLTRIHDNAIVVVIGHTGQIDLPSSELSGFSNVIEHFKDKPYAEVCELTKNFRGQLSRDADEM